MKILGVSANYHDSSAALVVDGKVVAAAAEERFTLMKHDPGFPTHSIDFCLKSYGITADEVDLIAYHESPEVKFSRSLSSAFVNFPYSLGTFLKTMKEHITGGFWLKNDISKKLNVDPRKIVFTPHHLSHAAHAFLTSPFDEAAVLTLDAVGEWTSTGLFLGNKNGAAKSIEPIGVVPFPHSLGLVYSAFTAFLGFKVNDGECSTMALAAFGTPKYQDQVSDILQIQSDGTYLINSQYFDFSQTDSIPVTEKFLNIFGRPREIKESLNFDCFVDQQKDIPAEQQRFADIAASLQLVLEKAILALVLKIQSETGAKNLAIAGGVALNCVANSKIVQSKIFENVYIPPDPGDGGGAMGAALYTALRFDPDYKFSSEPFSPYFGQMDEAVMILPMLEQIRPKTWQAYRRKDLGPAPGKLKKTQFDKFDELAEKVSEQISSGKIVGWVQGRFENGPRALGNRSILCDPSNIEAARRLSQSVKLRASFRPYAVSLTPLDAEKSFELEHSLLERWMQTSCRVKPEYSGKLRAALHVDGTSRIQVCFPEDNSRYNRLLEIHGRRTGLGGILNTSFNEKGFPIVNNSINALVMFARTDMDSLIIDNVMIEKEY